MKRAYLNLRHNVPERIEAVTQGLQKLGYIVTLGLPSTWPGPRDILVTWNRIRDGHVFAKRFESEGCRVLVMENASWGNDFLGRRWYTLGLGYHNRADGVVYGGPERWDSLEVPLMPMRSASAPGEVVILPQRGIGPPAVAMPLDWPRQALVRYRGARIRRHPGRDPAPDLRKDLAKARMVVTWGSGAAIKACMWGIPVVAEMPGWIGESDNTNASREMMLRRLAWAQWELKEYEDGSAFSHLLNR